MRTSSAFQQKFTSSTSMELNRLFSSMNGWKKTCRLEKKYLMQSLHNPLESASGSSWLRENLGASSPQGGSLDILGQGCATGTLTPLPYTRPSSKTLPFTAAHTYIAYMKEYPPPPTRALPQFLRCRGHEVKESSGSGQWSFLLHGNVRYTGLLSVLCLAYSCLVAKI